MARRRESFATGPGLAGASTGLIRMLLQDGVAGCGWGSRASSDRKSALATPYHGWADVIVVVHDLTVKTIETFVHIDFTAALNGPHRTDRLAELAAGAALRMPLQPVEHPYPAENSKAAA